MTDQTMLDIIDNVYESYYACYIKARDLFRDEQAVQSATATMLINATKEASTTKALNSQLRRMISEVKDGKIAKEKEIWNLHFKDLISELGPRVEMFIEHCTVERNYSVAEFEKHVLEYADRLRKEKEN